MSSVAAPVAISGRLPWVDGLRAVCALYIVGFWHLMDYVPAWPGFHNAVTQRLTVVVLGLFVLLSGFLLGQGRLGPGAAGVWRFWVRRLRRIYPLYLLALAAFWGCGLLGLLGAAKAALGLSMVWGPPPPTLWFVTALLLYYALAPGLMRALAAGAGAGLVAGLGVGLLLAVLVAASGRGDVRLLLYFPAFAAGLWLAQRGPGATPSPAAPASWRAQLAWAGACAAALGVSMAAPSAGPLPEASLWSLPLATVWPVALLWAVRRAATATSTSAPDGRGIGAFFSAAFWAPIAQASFAMYLFHRPVYLGLSVLLAHMGGAGGAVGADTPPLRLALLLGLGLPVVTALGWLLQRGQDRWLDRPRSATPGRDPA